MKFTQVRKLDTIEKFTAHLDGLGIDLPIAETVEPGGALAQPITLRDAQGGELEISNRFAVLPMEGWDGTTGGRPTDLVRRRWERFGASGCGLVWCEATAVTPGGRANPNQLIMSEQNVDAFAALRSVLDPTQVAGLQLTHSGRYSRPVAAREPRTAYEHPQLDARSGASAESVLTDDELDELVEQYIAAAVLAEQAGFSFVDVKHCHGYLLHELLTGHDRPGRYGGDLDGRTNFLRSVVAGIRERAPGLTIGVRLSVFDFAAFEPGDDGVGRPVGASGRSGDDRHSFGGDTTGLGIDLTETHEFCSMLVDQGVGLLSTTAGSPYYNPHIQRPATFPPSDGYKPPEDPLVGVARQIAATAELTAAHPELVVVGAGYTYLQEWLGNVAEAVVAAGGVSMVGLGRMMLSYPHLAADLLSGRSRERSLVCRTFSDCTTAPRGGLISGCFPLDPFYKEHPQRVELTRAKSQAKARLGGSR